MPVQVADPTTVTRAAATAAADWSTIARCLWLAVGATGPAKNLTKAAPEPRTDTRITYRTEFQTVPCIDTSGQTFAIWLNVLYLTPLTFLFVRFFVKSYIRRGELLAKKVQKELKQMNMSS